MDFSRLLSGDFGLGRIALLCLSGRVCDDADYHTVAEELLLTVCPSETHARFVLVLVSISSLSPSHLS